MDNNDENPIYMYVCKTQTELYVIFDPAQWVNQCFKS